MNGKEWRDRVDLAVYHLDQDPAAARPYEPITGATLIVDGRIRLVRLGVQEIRRALEQAVAEQAVAAS